MNLLSRFLMIRESENIRRDNNLDTNFLSHKSHSRFRCAVSRSIFLTRPSLPSHAHPAGGSAIWNLVATFFKLPISGTHTIVGATVGFSLCARGFDGVNWTTFGKIGKRWQIDRLIDRLKTDRQI